MILVLDSIVVFWSWEFIVWENLVYLVIFESCYLIGGFEGGLLLFDLWVWRYEIIFDWWRLIFV